MNAVVLLQLGRIVALSERAFVCVMLCCSFFVAFNACVHGFLRGFVFFEIVCIFSLLCFPYFVPFKQLRRGVLSFFSLSPFFFFSSTASRSLLCKGPTVCHRTASRWPPFFSKTSTIRREMQSGEAVKRYWTLFRSFFCSSQQLPTLSSLGLDCLFLPFSLFTLYAYQFV